MERKQVDSSNITSVGYDPRSSIMEIEFRDGRIYQYFDVPEPTFTNLVGASSVGKSFHQSVRGQYAYARL